MMDRPSEAVIAALRKFSDVDAPVLDPDPYPERCLYCPDEGEYVSGPGFLHRTACPVVVVGEWVSSEFGAEHPRLCSCRGCSLARLGW